MRQFKKVILLAFLLCGATAFVGCNDDKIKPEILGTANFTIEVNSNEPNWLNGVSATDDKDGDITVNIVVDDSNVILNTLGTYTLTYCVTDSSDNTESVTVNVNVIDTTDPEILGLVNRTVEVNSSPNWLTGITATDSYNGNLTSSITVDDSNVNLTLLGTYQLNFTVKDSSDNEVTGTIDVIVVDTTDPVILGAVDLQVEARSTPNWLTGITASDNYDGNLTSSITVDSETVNLNLLGTYTLTYSVTDENDNETNVDVNVEVVYLLPQTLIDLDVALLTELVGTAPTAEQLLLLESANVLRSQNYGMLYMPGMVLDATGVQQYYYRTLSTEEIQLILDYDNYWINTLYSGTYAPGLDQYDIQRIMYSFIIGRELTTAEADSLPIISALQTEYEASYVSGTNSEFGNAGIAEIESVIARSLTTEEINALTTQNSLKNAMMSNMLLIMMTSQVGDDLTLEQIDAIKLIGGYIITLSSGDDGLPSVEDAQTILGVTFTSEEISAYAVVVAINDEIMFNMVLTQVETQIGREMTESEIAQLRVYVVVMFEYMAVYSEGYDPEFQDATVNIIEIIIGRTLTQEEVDSLEFMNTIMSIAMIENAIGRSLTETEKVAVPVINALEIEYNSLYESGVDPEMESATDLEIETVLGRSLTQTELDALVIFRAILAEIV
ncbi:MAG: DUF5011 domain-containing protein [Clostridia bacterium]|jgi:hypothetical protein|nr:DUF5011 domain-containing protein [Clostridia bacterium]